MEPTSSSETSAFILRTPEKFPKEHRLHSEHSESLKTTSLYVNKSIKSWMWTGLIVLTFEDRIKFTLYLKVSTYVGCGPGISVGIATDYGLDGLGIESRWGRNFPPVQTGPGAHSASCTMGTGSFRGVNCSRGVLLTTHPLLALRSWKSRAISLHTLWDTTRPVTWLLYFLHMLVTKY